VLIVLAGKDMLETTIRRGVCLPIYMDATRGLQKYGLKLITVHIKDEESQGKFSGVQITLGAVA
jgi:hypothetical protein